MECRYPPPPPLFGAIHSFRNAHKECNILFKARKTTWLSTISHVLQLIDLDLNQIFQNCRLDSKHIVHKTENNLKSCMKRGSGAKFVSPVDLATCTDS